MSLARPRRLTHAHEILDEPDQDPEELASSLDHVAAVNRWLGGIRALLRHLPAVLPPEGAVRLLDVGTGSGDLPRAVARWARRRRRPFTVMATDIHAQTLEVARRRSGAYPEIRFTRLDVRDLPFANGSFDAALLAMTLHHMNGDDAVVALRELARVAPAGVVVSELERSWPNYLGARVLASSLWRRNRITRHDGPISVLRAFTPAELLELARDAGLSQPRVHRHPFYRLILTAAAEPGRATAA